MRLSSAAGTSPQTPREKGDSELAQLYENRLRENHNSKHTSHIGGLRLERIPASSTFGQWRQHLQKLLHMPDFVNWANEHRVDLSKPITIFPPRGVAPARIACVLKSDAEAGSSMPSIRQFPAFPRSWPLITQAATVLANGQLMVQLEKDGSARMSDVARFYGERLPQAQEQLHKRVEELQLSGVLGTGGLDNEQIRMRSDDALTGEQQKLGDIQNRHQFNDVLKNQFLKRYVPLLLEVEERAELPPADRRYLRPDRLEVRQKEIIEECLEATSMPVAEQSGYARTHGLAMGERVSLKRFINDNAWLMPTNKNALEGLFDSNIASVPVQPAHGDFGGALSWPMPASDQDLRGAYYHPVQSIATVAEHGLFKLLTQRFDWSEATLAHPRAFIEQLLESPIAKEVGAELNAKYGGASSASSVSDWALTALQVSLDKETLLDQSQTSKRTRVAGFDLADPRHVTQHPSQVVQALATHLHAQGKTTAPLAPIAAHLLLSRCAPAYLVKDIPPGITYGSHTWLSLEVAVARLEAKAPGSTGLMTYAQVMKQTQVAPMSADEQAVEFTAQHAALKDWAVANGVVARRPDDEYTQAQMRTVRNAFNEQLDALKNASAAYASTMPTRREIALDELERAYGKGIPFEEKCLTSVLPNRDYPGPYSLLDIYLSQDHEHKIGHEWRSSNPAIQIHMTRGVYNLPDPTEKFNQAFAAYVGAMKKAIATQTRHLIASLPLDDRRHIEFGKLTVGPKFSTPHTGFGPGKKTRVPNEHTVLLETVHKGETRIYELNLKDSTLRRTDTSPPTLGDMSDSAGKRIFPHADRLLESPAKPDTHGLFQSFGSERTTLIADAMVADADIQRHEAEARGQTTFETEVPFYKKGREFLLNLIPLRSAIKSFSEGDAAGGIIDLSMDIFGFMVGAGATAKGARLLRGGSRLSQGVSIIGRAAIGVLNPLDGVGRLAFNGLKGLQQGGLNVIRTLRGSADGYSLVDASRRFDASAMGTFKRLETINEGPAVLQNGKWFAFDTLSKQPYGKPLDDFKPVIMTNAQMQEAWHSATSTDASNPRNWVSWVEEQKTGPHSTQFNQGYAEGDPLGIFGYRVEMKSDEVMRLARSNALTPAEAGTLVRQRERLAVQHGFKGVDRVYEHISAANGKLTPIPQLLYLSQTNPLSKGQCAAMSRVMASAMEQGQESHFIANMFTTAANPMAAESRAFVGHLTSIQKQLETPTQFHAAMPVQKMGYRQLITELIDTKSPKTMMINTADHAMMAGVRGEGAAKRFFFYDPNYGLCEFPSADAMRKGLDKLFTDKRLPIQYNTVGTAPSKLEFNVSTYTDSWKKTNDVPDAAVRALIDKPIGAQPSPLAPGRNGSVKPPHVVDSATTGKAQTVEVFVAESKTLEDRTSILKTDGLSDCSALVVLTDLQDGIYQKRTLIHLNGSNLDAPVDRSSNAFELIRQLDESLQNGGKVIFVGGTATRSAVGVGSVLGQANSQGGKPLLALMQKKDVSVTYASSVGVEVYPDGRFKLRDDDGAGVFDNNKIKDILDWARD
ncbi:hypothetical protein BFW86_13675 [Pseudomonas fluorescens]|nr:hypothetical protein BFW86_13675 [Pseudomonas fluorescens]